jgi:putative hydrolase
MKLPDTSDFRSIVDKIREGDLATLIVGPERRAALDAMQAFMAVLEGYAEHVMDEVGAEILPNLPELRGAMDRRRRDRSGLLRIFEKLIGMDMKLRQYELGKQFCDAVAKAGGIAALNRVWEGPAQMPTLAELEDPDAWMARTGPARAA